MNKHNKIKRERWKECLFSPRSYMSAFGPDGILDIQKIVDTKLYSSKPVRVDDDVIRNILVNKKKKLVTVVFSDGNHEIIKCDKDDNFDINVGVALAIAQHAFGSKTHFHKVIAKKTRVI